MERVSAASRDCKKSTGKLIKTTAMTTTQIKTLIGRMVENSRKDKRASERASERNTCCIQRRKILSSTLGVPFELSTSEKVLNSSKQALRTFWFPSSSHGTTLDGSALFSTILRQYFTQPNM